MCQSLALTLLGLETVTLYLQGTIQGRRQLLRSGGGGLASRIKFVARNGAKF